MTHHRAPQPTGEVVNISDPFRQIRYHTAIPLQSDRKHHAVGVMPEREETWRKRPSVGQLGYSENPGLLPSDLNDAYCIVRVM